jgi:lipid A 3-O-deacylase
MRFFVLLMTVLMLACFSNNVLADDFHLDSPRNKGGTWRFELDNDVFLGTDSNFSNGWSIQYHTVRYSSWEDSRAYDWVKWVGQHFPTLGDEGSIVRYAHGIGQNLITPGDISNPNPPPGDLPYAGTLHYNLGWQRFNPETASIFQLNIGVLGKEAFGEEVQKFVHDDLDIADTPMGWDTQRDTELILNLGYSHIWRVLQFGEYDNAWGGQVTTGVGFHLGNLVTGGDVGFALRFGWNIPEGFNSFPAPPGRGFFSNLTLAKPASASPHSVEFILAARATGFAYSVLYDGSKMTDDERDIEREDFVFGGLFGLNYHHYEMLSLRLALLVTTDLLDEDALPPALSGTAQTSSDNSYGTIMIDFYF